MTNTQYFLIRRLHSLLGVIPLGVFLFAHMTTNSMAFFGQEAFDHKVDLIHSLGPLLPFVEAAMIFVPLALHIIIGIVIAQTGVSNTSDLGYARNWAYTLQRWTGWAAVAFIVYHAFSLRILDVAGGRENFFAYMSYLFRFSPVWPVWLAVYLLGGVAVIYHFANGLCTFCMTWGITVGPKSQKVMAGIAAATAVLLLSMLIGSMIGFYINAPAEAAAMGSAIQANVPAAH
ncbi:MAG: succinate dehydrogenase / fumarate reductase, cytochrome b subunit [Candidatus Sumerlaeota bacterium]|nr:succinate dehydrogenase / fumarate reductase, cytochrome b subunit [Candidatus Sumerlaeota bacterium]